MFVRNPLVFKAIAGVHRVDDVCEARWRVSLLQVACQAGRARHIFRYSGSTKH